MRLTLLSASPRRRELLARLGIPFDVQPTHTAEIWTGSSGEELATANARRKVERSPLFGDRSRVLLGADTIIDLDGRFFGKPAGEESARRMLKAIAGRDHRVVTGYSLWGPTPSFDQREIWISAACVSRVTFRALTQAEIAAYIATGEWRGKAGAYAIQETGKMLVETLTGDFENVVGLPVSMVNDDLSQSFSHCRFLR